MNNRIWKEWIIKNSLSCQTQTFSWLWRMSLVLCFWVKEGDKLNLTSGVFQRKDQTIRDKHQDGEMLIEPSDMCGWPQSRDDSCSTWCPQGRLGVCQGPLRWPTGVLAPILVQKEHPRSCAGREWERPRVGLGKIWCMDMYLNLTVKFTAISTMGAQIQKLSWFM